MYAIRLKTYKKKIVFKKQYNNFFKDYIKLLNGRSIVQITNNLRISLIFAQIKASIPANKNIYAYPSLAAQIYQF